MSDLSYALIGVPCNGAKDSVSVSWLSARGPLLIGLRTILG